MNISKYCLQVGEKHLLKVFFEISAAFVPGILIGSLKEQIAITALLRLAFILI